jgi:superoxide dismutase
MKELIKILLADEKKVAQLTAVYNELKKNIEKETNADKITRTNLYSNIAAMKKANAAIVNHCLNERQLSPVEIEKITNAHAEEPKPVR